MQSTWAELLGLAACASCVDLGPPSNVACHERGDCDVAALDSSAGSPADAAPEPPADAGVVDAGLGETVAAPDAAVAPPDAGSLTVGLVGYWRFDEGSGTIAGDSAGDNRGTLVKGPAWTSDVFPNPQFPNPYALRFDGLDDLVTAPAGSALANLRVLTVTAWIKPASAGQIDLGRIVDKRNPAGWMLILTGPQSSCANGTCLLFAYNFTTTEGRWKTAPGTIALGSWQHVAVTYDGTSTSHTPSLYINGAEVAAMTEKVPSGSPTDDSASPLVIGNTRVGDRTFNGSIDDVRVYGRILSPDEVADLAGGR